MVESLELEVEMTFRLVKHSPLYTARHDIMLTHNIFVNFHERNLRAYINFDCEIIMFMLK